MADEAEQGNVKLERARFHLAESIRQDYVAIVQQELKPHDLENPALWSNVANLCRPFGRIEARCEDGTWIAEFVILEVGRQFVRVKMLQHYKLTTEDVAITQTAQASGYKVYWRGQHHQWAVQRLSDTEIVHQNEGSREAAESWLKEHLKAFV